MQSGMESGPALFAGVTLALFGAGLVVWTSVRLRAHQPVAQGVPPVAGAAAALLFGVISLLAGGWVLSPG